MYSSGTRLRAGLSARDGNDQWRRTLFHKVWDAHAVRVLPSGQTQLFVGLHLVHEVTSPQAFDMLRQHGWRVAYPERTFATVDHIVPTSAQTRPFIDLTAEEMTTALERNCRQSGIQLWAPGGEGGEHQGIVHVIGPELGLTQPGMTIACGDSHTSTHGALGAIAFGIGTSQVRDVLASQCLALDPLKVRRIDVNGQLRPGVYAKDVILTIIRRLGVQGGVGFAYEYGGSTLDRMTIDERMTICNMSIEGGARVGYVNPDETTFAYLKGRRFVPSGAAFDRAVAWWRSIASDPAARVRRPRHPRRRLDRADRHLGDQPGAVGRHQRADRRECRRGSAGLHGLRARERGSRGRASTSPSSARARTDACPTSKRRRGSSAAAASRRTSRRSSSRAHRPSAAPPKRKGCPRSSRRPDSNGAAPAARCAWP